MSVTFQKLVCLSVCVVVAVYNSGVCMYGGCNNSQLLTLLITQVKSAH